MSKTIEEIRIARRELEVSLNSFVADAVDAFRNKTDMSVESIDVSFANVRHFDSEGVKTYVTGVRVNLVSL